jgi:hypothetical protein
MNTTSRILSVIVSIAFFSFSAYGQRQTKLYIDNGSGAFSVLESAGAGTITFPTGTGTLVTSASSPSIGSLIYANGAGGWTTLSPGTNTYALTLTGGIPEWEPEAGFSLPYSQSFAPGSSTAAFAITNTSNSGYAIEGIDNASSGGIGLFGQTNTGAAGVDGSSAGTGPGLYGSNSGTTGSALATYTFLGNSQPNISITNYGHGPDIEGSNDAWQVDKSGNGTFATLFVAPTGSQSGIAINNTGNFLDIEGNRWGVDGAGDIYAYGIITAELDNDAGYVNMDPTGTYPGLINFFSQGHAGAYDIVGTNLNWSVNYNGNGTFNNITTTGIVIVSAENDIATKIGGNNVVSITGNTASTRITSDGTVTGNVTATFHGIPFSGQLLYIVNQMGNGHTVTLNDSNGYNVADGSFGIYIYMNGTWFGK